MENDNENFNNQEKREEDKNEDSYLKSLEEKSIEISRTLKWLKEQMNEELSKHQDDTSFQLEFTENNISVNKEVPKALCISNANNQDCDLSYSKNSFSIINNRENLLTLSPELKNTNKIENDVNLIFNKYFA